MSDRQKDFQIVLEDNKTFIPGDQIKGHIVVHSTKSIDVQHISLCLKCNAEIQGDKKVLLDTVVYLATPKSSKSSTNVLSAYDTHRFPFTFTLSEDLPGTLKIPRIASVTYTLTAVHKKPRFKLSPTLPTQVLEIQVERVLDIHSDDRKKEKKQTTQFGHIIGSNETEWSTIIPRTGFARGGSIPVSMDISYFPPFVKDEAIKISLLRLVNKMEPFKIVEKNVLSSKTVDLDTRKNPSQYITVSIDIPTDTPISLFPPNGQIMSIQYIIESELYLKGVKKTFIKAQKVYTHENVIVIGTIPKKTAPLPPVDINRKLTDSMYITPSRLTSVRTVENKPSIMSMRDSASSSRASIVMHNSGYDTLKPLKRLDSNAPLTYYTYKRRSTKEEINASSLSVSLEEARKHTQSVPNVPKMMNQEREEPPCLPMLIKEEDNHYPVAAHAQYNNKPYEPRPIEHQDSFQSYNSFSDDSRSPATPGPSQYFNEMPQPSPHPLHYPNSQSLHYREQITGTSVPHEYSAEDLEAKHLSGIHTPELSRHNTLSTVSTNSTNGLYQKPR